MPFFWRVLPWVLLALGQRFQGRLARRRPWMLIVWQTLSTLLANVARQKQQDARTAKRPSGRNGRSGSTRS
ncbi:hypothetical protein [Laribacter hongkongensis]|uniref:hypothetical protein n=1 Tax=Laribacter hongkongensis TaxID=168471 RepID=UPI001EFE515F|nr:hypothetical protein [Laribacter hongkongensis]MCG9030536.1 hypothetical protein [Laribacter hongkongensis]MCG9090625.1 hypothetical protein [Laribacter hongkongensis]